MWLLWYSSLGLFLTGVALVTKNKTLLASMFCALFLIESTWSIGFLSMLLFKKSIFGIASYAFAPDYSKKDFYISLYHLLIPIALLIGVKEQSLKRFYGWIGASVYTGVLAGLTFMLADKNDSLNCVYTIKNCLGFKFVGAMGSPVLAVAIFCFLTLFIFIPSDYLRKTRFPLFPRGVV